MGDVAAPRELIAGRYEIVRPLGRGEVLLARQLSLDRLVVIKRGASAQTRIAARLHHPNIVNILDVVEREGDPVVVMELVVGVSLHELLESSPTGLPVEVALAIASDVLRALAYAHHVGVVHHNVNPRDIMVTFGGTTRLVYMSPGQIHNDDQVAVGVMLRAMFAGTIASARLAEIVARACAEDPGARFASCSELLLALEDHLADSGIAATATHVERWTSPRFADQRAALERDAEALPSTRPLPPIAHESEPAQYRRVLHDYFATGFPDSRALAVRAREVVSADPTWAHSYALLWLIEGRTTPEAIEAVETGLSRTDRTRDPSGAQLLEACSRTSRGEYEAAYPGFLAVYEADETDLLATFLVLQVAVVIQRTDEATALTRKLHRAHPELVFGVDLADAFRRSGRGAAAEAVIRTWLAASPNSLPARAELARIDAAAGRLADAVAHANRAMTMHADRDEALPDVFEAMIASEQIEIAEQVADRMLVSGSSLTRARGRYRFAIAAVFEGRFAAAYDSVRRAIDEHRAFGGQSELTQCLELARSVATLVGDAAAQRRFTAELIDVLDLVVGDSAAATATRYELALLARTGPPPSIDDHLAGLDDGPARDVARRRMLRAAALADCGSPHKAVAAGFSAFEENAASLLALGLCAVRLRELDLARHAIERASQLWSSMISTQNSPYHAIVARFHLAGVLVELGDRAGARRLYESFLRLWASADRPIPEVAMTRELLAHI